MNSTPDYTVGLNPAQASAVNTLSGPILILAGAGSGKTKTLTHRIANLVAHGVHPSEILAVTFTNKAATEMKTRIAELLGESIRFPFMGTFHGICVRLLRIEHLAANLDPDFTIYDTSDQETLIRRLLKEQGITNKTLKPKSILSTISHAKNHGETPDSFAATAYYPQQKQLASLFASYETAKTYAGALDFDDLLIRTATLFRENADLRHKWQQRFRHILIDEYQDTNVIQYRLIKSLVSKERNICAVGDDWQSIYSWRGADFTNILNFERDFPGATIIKLEQNYRSTGNILDVSQKVISNNKTRTDKTLFTTAGAGADITIKSTPDEQSEARFVATEITHYLSQLYHTKDILSREKPFFSHFAVLYRTNAQSHAFEKAFITSKIPYKIIGGTRFYDRKEIKDLLALLKFTLNQKDLVSFERIAKNILKGIGTVSLARILTYLNATSAAPRLTDPELLSALPAKARTAIQDLSTFTSTIDLAAPPTDTIRSAIEYFHLPNDTANEEELLDRTKNLEVLVGNAETYDHLSTFLADAALMSSADETAADNAVTLMTLHAAKGLEFPVVFLVGLEDGLFPSLRSAEEEELEEERRLAYVGMTRAMKKLYLTYARSRFSFQGRNYAEPSRFLLEIGHNPHGLSSQSIDISNPNSLAANTTNDNFYSDSGYDLDTDQCSAFDSDPFPDDLPFFE